MGRHDRLLHTLYKLFIEHYIQVLFIFPLSAAGWLAGLAGVFGVAAVRLIILAAITVYGLLLLLYLGGMLVAFKRKIKKLEQNLLSIDRSLQRVEKERDELGISTASIVRTNPVYYMYNSWKEEITIRENGDTFIERNVTIVPGQTGINMVFMSLFGNSALEGTQNVEFKAYIIKEGSGEMDANYVSIWENENKFAGFIYLDRSYYESELVKLRCTWEWPAYSEEVAKGNKERHSIALLRECNTFECNIVIIKNPQIGNRKVSAEFVRDSIYVQPKKSVALKTQTDSQTHRVSILGEELDANTKFAVQLAWVQ